MPSMMSAKRSNNKKGVKKLPMMSTTFEGTIVRAQVATKNKMDDHTGLKSGKEGRIAISCVVAAVRGIAIKGPIHNMIIDPNIGASLG